MCQEQLTERGKRLISRCYIQRRTTGYPRPSEPPFICRLLAQFKANVSLDEDAEKSLTAMQVFNHF